MAIVVVNDRNASRLLVDFLWRADNKRLFSVSKRLGEYYGL